MPTIELKSQAQVKDMFDEASRLGLQHYHWIPPNYAALGQLKENGNLIPNTKALEDNSSDDGEKLFVDFLPTDTTIKDATQRRQNRSRKKCGHSRHPCQEFMRSINAASGRWGSSFTWISTSA